MTTKTYKINYLDYAINYEIVVEEGGYWAIDSKRHLIHNDKVVCLLDDSIQYSIAQTWVFFRKLDEEHFLIVERFDNTEENAWIIDRKGKLVQGFFVGKDVARVHITDDKIIITHYYLTDLFNPNVGLLYIFDSRGKLLQKVEDFQGEFVSLCAKANEEMFIYNYDNDELILFSINTYEFVKYDMEHLNFYIELMFYSQKDQILYVGMRDLHKKGMSWRDCKMNIYTCYFEEHKLQINRDNIQKIRWESKYLPLKDGKVLEINLHDDENQYCNILDFDN